MTIPDAHAQALGEFPQPLQDLVRAELAVGNAILQIGAGFPAPPVGACLRLARPVTTRPRRSGGDLDFYERNHPDHSGEFTDGRRFFFVLEPPRPSEPEPDMDALRAEARARATEADAARLAATAREVGGRRPRARLRPAAAGPRAPAPPTPLVERFRRSQVMDQERWREGTGFDLGLLGEATAAERAQLEALLLAGGVKDWRDVEALAALATPGARAALRQAFGAGDDGLRIALLSHAPDLFSPKQRTTALVSALGSLEVYGGLTQALLLVEVWHPAPVVEALLEGLLRRDGATAGAFAAHLLFLHGRADSPYDMAQRSFCLSFHGSDRTGPFRALCARIGLGPVRQEAVLARVRA